MLCGGGTIGEESENLGIVHKLLLTKTPGNEQDVEFTRASLKGGGGLYTDPGIGADEVCRLPHKMNIGKP